MYSHFNKSAPILTHCIYLSWNKVLASDSMLLSVEDGVFLGYITVGFQL